MIMNNFLALARVPAAATPIKCYPFVLARCLHTCEDAYYRRHTLFSSSNILDPSPELSHAKLEDPYVKSGFHSRSLQRHGATPTARGSRRRQFSHARPTFKRRLQYLLEPSPAIPPPPHQRRWMRGTGPCATTHLHLRLPTSLRRLLIRSA
jgi:hypothetical protein